MEGNRGNRIGKIRGIGIKDAIDVELETGSAIRRAEHRWDSHRRHDGLE